MKNPVTTISGLIVLLIGGLTIFGVITSEEQVSLTALAEGLIEAIIGIIAIFKAGDKGGI